MRTPLILWIVGIVIGATALNSIPTSASDDVRPAKVESATEGTQREASVATTNTRQHPGRLVYLQRGCNVCHGSDLTGTSMGPNLIEAREFWTMESIVIYLGNPDSSAVANSRLKSIKERYRRFTMPAFELEDGEFASLSAFLLDAR